MGFSMYRVVTLIIIFVISGCMPGSSGPSPKAVYVVSSVNYQAEKILDSIDSLIGLLDNRIDKKQEFTQIGEDKIPMYGYYEMAHWYPYKESEFYGVSIIKWESSAGGDTENRYFIDVYEDGGTCLLCDSVKKALEKSIIQYFSACENPKTSTKHEKIRCDT